MWHVATKKHEGYRVAIYRVLIAIAPKLGPQLLLFLFKKAQGIPLA